MTASHGVGRKPGDGKAQHQCIASPSVTPPGLHFILSHSGGCARWGLRPLRGLRPPRSRAYPRLVFFHPLRGLKFPRAFSPKNSNLSSSVLKLWDTCGALIDVAASRRISASAPRYSMNTLNERRRFFSELSLVSC